MKNMKIGKRLILAFIIVAILASISGIVGLTVAIQTDRNYSSALVVNGFSQGDIGRFNTFLNKGGAVVRDIIFLTDKAELDSARAELDGMRQSTLDALAALKETCQTPEELVEVAIIDENLPLFQTSRDKVVALGLENRNDEALVLFRTETRVLLNKCMDAATRLADINKIAGNEVSARLSAQSTLSAIIIVVVIITSLVLSILLGYSISRGISRPVAACAARFKLMAEGDLHSEIPPATSRDEVGEMLNSMAASMNATRSIIDDLSHALGTMAQGDLTVIPQVEYMGDYEEIRTSMSQILSSFNKTLRDINTASDQVSSGGEQVSAGAQALSQGATEQASSVEELAATIAEVAEQIKQNASSASDASTRANQVGEEAEESNRRMTEMLTAMAEISSASGEIGKIIKTIEDIAFQTNILALNAAVEAARAGAAGKGFAVVADEVRNLANKSQEASKNTAVLIESTLAAVERGAQLAGATSDSLHAVVGGIADVSTTVDKISVASREQAASVSQVNVGVEQISSVVQTNSATAEESAAASEELSGQAAMLRSLVGQFRLRQEENNYTTM